MRPVLENNKYKLLVNLSVFKQALCTEEFKVLEEPKLLGIIKSCILFCLIN